MHFPFSLFRRKPFWGILGSLSLTLLDAQSLDWKLIRTVEWAEHRYAALTTETLHSNQEQFVNYTTASGIWRIQNDATWTSGFLPGTLWYLDALAPDPIWASRAVHWDAGVRSRAYATDNDTGFQILDSFGTALEVGATVDVDDYTRVLLDAADTLVTERWNPTIGALRAWPANTANPTSMPFEVNIDMLMNLELLFWATEHGGPESYRTIAISHADRSWEDLVREDGSTFHVVSYDASGNVLSERTHQGWKRDSTWSRGQAWGVYGYTMLYRHTALPRMLTRAEALLAYFLEATEADAGDAIPFSDFDAPLDSLNPRDSSAAAIIASAALELYHLTGESRHRDVAERILQSLSAPPYLATERSWQSLLTGASEKWGESEVGAIFADFYLLEAVWRYWNWLESDLGSWRGQTIESGYQLDHDPTFGRAFVAYAPWIYRRQTRQWVYVLNTDTPAGGEWGYFARPATAR